MLPSSALFMVDYLPLNWFVKNPLQHNKTDSAGHKQAFGLIQIDVPLLTANIFAATNNITNINNKIGGAHL
jgi:hypothetical protein